MLFKTYFEIYFCPFLPMVWKNTGREMQHWKKECIYSFSLQNRTSNVSTKTKKLLLTSGRQLSHHAIAHNCGGQQPMDSWPTNLWWPHLNNEPWAYSYTVDNAWGNVTSTPKTLHWRVLPLSAMKTKAQV